MIGVHLLTQNVASNLGELGSLAGVTGSNSDLGAVLGGILTLTGMSLGSGLELQTAHVLGVSANVTFGLLSLGTLIAIAFTAHRIVRRASRLDGNPTTPIGAMARSAAEAALSALVLCLVTGFWRITLSGIAGLSSDLVYLTGRPWSIFFVMFVVLGLASFTARMDPRWTRHPLFFGVREAASATGLLLAIFTVCSFIALIIAAPSSGAPSALLLLIPVLGNIGAWAAHLGFLGGISYSQGSPIMAWNFAAGGAPFFVVAAIAVLVTATWIGARRTRTPRPMWRRSWQLVVFSIVLWLILDLLVLPISISGGLSTSSSDAVSASISTTWWSFFTMIAALGGISALAEVMPGFVYGLSPRLLGLLAGRAHANAWLNAQPGADAAVLARFVSAPQPSAGYVTTAGVGAPPYTAPAGAPPYTAPAADQPATNVTPPVTPPVVTQAAPWTPPQAPSSPPPAPPSPAGFQAAQGGPGTSPAPAPMSASAKQAIVVVTILVVAIAVLLGVLFGAVGIANSRRGPDTVVSRYLNLLAAGNAEAATAMVDPGVSNNQRALLTNATMSNAQARIQVISVDVASTTAKSATVEATLSLNGQRYTKDFSVTAGPNQYGLLKTWTLRDPYLVPVSISTGQQGLDQVSVGGTTISADSGSQFAYPGIYSVTVPPAMGKYLTAAQTQLVARDSTASSVTISAQPTQAFQDSVLSQAQQFLTSCVTAPGNLNDSCPYSVRESDLNSMKVITQPSGFTSLSMTDFTTNSAVIQTQESPIGTYTPSPDTSNVEVQGDITIGSDGAPTITNVDSN